MKFVIMTCVYNGRAYIEKCMKSVREQTYKNYVHIVVDDASTDKTYMEMTIHGHSRTRLYQNDKNIKWVRNALRYLSDHVLSEEDVIVILDGDDYLAHEHVLEILRLVYEKSKCWMTYSLFEYLSSGHDSSWIGQYSENVLRERTFRDDVWRFTHLRTFKSFLWDALNKDDLRGPNGEYTIYTYDQALLFPMLEMCQYGKIEFVDNVMYVYNNENPLQVENIEKVKQQALGRWFRSKSRYEILKR